MVTGHSQPLLDALGRAGIRTVIIGGSDTAGVMRGKRVPIAGLPAILDGGMALCDVFWVLHLDESDLVRRPDDHRGYFPTERAGYPDQTAIVDASTLRVLPWHDATALLLCDWHLPHGGGEIPISPRGVLRQVIGRAEQMGLVPLSALELEFYLLDEPVGGEHRLRADELTPLQQRPSTYGVVLGSHQEPVVARIRDALIGAGLPLDAMNPETGPGQFELNLRYGPSLAAADNAFVFKSAVKELAGQQGLLATFMAKPHHDWAGNSAHLHLSLTDTAGSPLFYDPDAPHSISRTMRHFIGGILATMADATALLAPTSNSYRRYRPYSWAGDTATWGIDNRSAGLRAIVEGQSGTRIEHRQGGGDVNPYLATAAALAGGLYGIEHEIEPPEAIDDDAYALPPDPATALPRSLAEATDRLEASAWARAWLGDDLVDHFVVTRRADLAAQASHVPDWEISRYLEAL